MPEEKLINFLYYPLGPKLGFKRSLTSNEDDDETKSDDDHNVEEDETKNTMVEKQKVEIRKSSTAWCN